VASKNAFNRCNAGLMLLNRRTSMPQYPDQDELKSCPVAGSQQQRP
jgi:hypothetical protein